MGRPENDLPPAGAVSELARWLQRLRERAGSPPYREMARMTGLAATTLSRAASGTSRPEWKTVFVYTQACGGDTDKALTLWNRVAEKPPRARGAHSLRNGVRRPEHVSTRADLVKALNYLRISAGQPSLRQLENIAHDSGGRALPDATVSDLLAGKRGDPSPDLADVPHF